MALVDTLGADNQTNNDVKEYLCFGLISKSKLRKVINSQNSIQLIDSISLGKPKLISKKEFATIPDEKILFYKTLEDLRQKRPYY
jgi:hypothetical protein